MLNRPVGITDGEISEALARHWSIDGSGLRYAPVGFGSHHWTTEDHFVTIDEIDEGEDATGLEAALRTSSALRHDAGLGFVVAPIPTETGALLVPLDPHGVLHVYERLDVVDDTTFGRHHDPEVVGLVRAIHDATPVASAHAHREDFSIWRRDALEEALGQVHESWTGGPYSERARRLLADHADAVHQVLARHDRMVADIPDSGWVVTHGEPHRGNIFRTSRGWAVVDWDTVLVAPAERDLWSLSAGGRDGVNRLYRLRWDLAEIAVYISDFRGDHTGDANDDQAWRGLIEHLDPRRWLDLST